MGITVGGHGKGPRKRRTRRFTPGQPAKPFLPAENPFPEKGEFRLGTYRVLEVKDDYLVCEGYDPRAKNPAAEYTPSAVRRIKVAKPPLLLKTPWDGSSALIKNVTYNYEYNTVEMDKRTVTWEDSQGNEHEYEEVIKTPYYEDDLILAVEVSKNSWQNWMEVNGTKVVDEYDSLLSWVDLNVSGRHWNTPDEECGYYHQFVIVGGSGLPTSGSHVFEYTIGAVTANLQLEFDMTASELRSEILLKFIALTSDDVECDGGPWPQFPLEVQWKRDAAEQVAEDSPPTLGTNTLNNNCWVGVWPSPSWGG